MVDAVETGRALLDQARHWIADGKTVRILIDGRENAVVAKEVTVAPNDHVGRLVVSGAGPQHTWYVALRSVIAVVVAD